MVRGEKQIQKNLVSLLCLYPAVSFADSILSHTVCSANGNWGMSHTHPNNVPLHSYKMCYVSSQQHSSLLQARHQIEMPEVWISRTPGTPEREWEGCSAWGVPASKEAFNHEKSSGWVYEVKWVNNWVSKMERELIPRAQSTQGAQMPRRLKSFKWAHPSLIWMQDSPNVWKTGYSTLKIASFDLYFTFKYDIQCLQDAKCKLKTTGRKLPL